MSFIGSLLVDGEKAPFYQSLLEANIGSDYSPVIGLVCILESFNWPDIIVNFLK